MSNFTKGFLAIIGAVLFWSVNETMGTLVFQEGASALTLLTMRFGIATILVFLTLFVLNKELLKVRKEHIKTILVGTIIMTLHLIGFWQGIKTMNSVVMAVGIFYLFPIWTVILSFLFWKEKFGKKEIISLGVGVLGAMFALKCFPSLSFSDFNWIGILWMLLAGFGWSGYIMVNKKISKEYNPFTLLFYNFAGAVVIFFLLQSPMITIRELTVGIVLKTAFMALTASYGAFMLYNYALKYISATKASITNLSKMFFSVLAAYLILSQTATIYQILGLTLIFSSIYLLKKDG